MIETTFLYRHGTPQRAFPTVLREPLADQNRFPASQRSVSRAAMQPLAAAVTAWR